MAIAKPVIDARVAAVSFESELLIVALVDGRELRVPLAWFPRLEHGTPAQLADYRVIEGGRAISWPELDEDIGIEPLLATSPW